MKLSYDWLKEYLICDLSPKEIADAMTSIGIEVDGIVEQEQVKGSLEGVVVAKVLECEEHPNSDHLHITKVDDGSGDILTVVCGAPNIAAGQKVLFARIGTILPGDFKIKKAKVRGVESFGMICAEDELGIGEAHDGIMVLPQETQIGQSAKDYLNLKTEVVIEYEITANRVDAASHIGVARDLYAYFKHNNYDVQLRYPLLNEELAHGKGESVAVEVLSDELVKRYVSITIDGVKVAPSPEAFQAKLRSIGLNPINNIVDISNYVLFELGQPLHIFDADKISDNGLIVRTARDKENLTTLDGISRSLNEGDIVIADKNSVLCLAGIMGGLDSSVTESSQRVFIESAYFDPAQIRKTSKKHGLQTDSSFRFERGANIDIAEFAARRAAQLVLELAGGQIVSEVNDFYPHPEQKKQIEINYSRIARFIGKDIGKEVIDNILTYLSYEFVREDENTAIIKAPYYMVDVERECDVIEEILRIYGYNNIELPQTMRSSINFSKTFDPESLRNNISNFLAANGFVETMNNSLTKSEYYSKLTTFPLERCVSIVNPLSSDLNVMRQTLLLNALEDVSYNVNRQISRLKIFEYGSVYELVNNDAPEQLSSYKEHSCFSLLITGATEKLWLRESQKASFFELKAYIELLLKRYDIDIYSLPTKEAPEDIFLEGLTYYMPNSEEILIRMGTINPVLAKQFSIKQEVFAAEIHWQNLLQLISKIDIHFKELPKYPSVKRDLALLLDENISFASLRASAFRVSKSLLKNVSLFDVYRGDKLPENKKQYALSFIFQDLNKTLTDKEINKIVDKLISTFQNEYGAVLR